MIFSDSDAFSTPVALIIFNRPSTTRMVLERLRSVRPKSLFVIADGPRVGVSDDPRLCAEARAVINEIDWPCDVRRRFLDTNLGCGHSPAQGLDWVFSQVQSCIILEDDCAPDVSFFTYCQEMLALYKDDKRIMMVSGNNHLLNKKIISESYLFSINTQTHGWATWRRAWNEYDFFMADWPKLRSLDWLERYLGDKKYAKTWFRIFDNAFEEARLNPKCSYWDFQWTYACWKNHALNIIPCHNLVTNLGYGENSTHTSMADHPLANLPVRAMEFPLRHPPAMLQNYEADYILSETVYGNHPIYKRVFLKLLRIMKRVYGFFG
jgi:hypothetical protein